MSLYEHLHEQVSARARSFAPGRSVRRFQGVLLHLLVWLHALCQVRACLRLSRFALHSVCPRDCVVTARLTKATWQIHTCALTYQSRQGLRQCKMCYAQTLDRQGAIKAQGEIHTAQTHHAAHSFVRSCLNSDLRHDQKTSPSLYTHVALKPTPLPGMISQQETEGQFLYGPAIRRSRLHVSRPGAAVHDRQPCSSLHGRQPALCGNAGSRACNPAPS
jgi:hypothetical protein